MISSKLTPVRVATKVMVMKLMEREGFQVDLSNEFVAVDHIASVVSLIADHEVVGQTATCLDFAEELHQLR